MKCLIFIFIYGQQAVIKHPVRDVLCSAVYSEVHSRHRAAVSEEESKRANQALREAEAERRLAEKERQERTAESLSWREKHQELADRFRAQEDLEALRQSKAVGSRPGLE